MGGLLSAFSSAASNFAARFGVRVRKRALSFYPFCVYRAGFVVLALLLNPWSTVRGWQGHQLTNFPSNGQVRECGSVADSRGGLHHYIYCQLAPNLSDEPLYYLRSDFYGHVLTDTVRLNGFAGDQASPLDIIVLGDGEHSWCLFTEYIHGQGNRRGLYLTERDSDGQEILPPFIVRPNVRALKAVLRTADSTIHLLLDTDPIAYCRITTQGDTLLWGRPIDSLDYNSSVGGFFLDVDGTPCAVLKGAAFPGLSPYMLVRFAEDGSQAISRLLAADNPYWFMFEAQIDSHRSLHLIAGHTNVGRYYLRLDSSLVLRESYLLSSSEMGNTALQVDMDGNCLFVWYPSGDIYWAYRRADSTWTHSPAPGPGEIYAHDFSVVAMDSERYAFTCAAAIRPETQTDLYLFTYGFPPYNDAPPQPSLPHNFALSVYPNPFNNQANIRFELPVQRRVELKLFNVEGRLVCTLLDGVTKAGTHEVRVDGEQLPSGVYFVRLQTAGITRTQKILLLK